MAYRFGRTGSGHSHGKPRRRWGAWLLLLLKLSLIGLIVGGLLLTLILRPFHKKAQVFDLSQIGQLEAASLLYDRNGEQMGEDFRVQNRHPVTIDQVPKDLIQALIAVEDSRFFEHQGVDWIGVVRAVLLNFKAGRRTQGASTITQQLGRQSFGLLDDSYGRKLTEAFLAHRIEENFTKEQILEHYLNRIFFGHGFDGVNAAAKGYFGKHVSEVNLEEAAMLCGLIKAPNFYSPLRDGDRAQSARNHVLDRMVAENFLTPENAEVLKKRPVITNPQPSISRSSHAFHFIRQEITDKLGETVAAQGGFRVFTTLDIYLQKLAQSWLREHLAEAETHPDFDHQTYQEYLQIARDVRSRGLSVPNPEYLQGALLAIDNNDGGIISMVGGRNFQHFQFNCATQARRPAGSAFKPFVFALAFQNAMFPGTIVTDKVIDNKFVQIGGVDGLLGEWAVETPSQQYLGDITARKALTLSKNAATIRLALRVGLEAFLEFVQEAGFDSPMRPYNSSFLGSSEVTLAEMCKAYTIFANGGLRPKDLYIIREIQAADGTPLYTAPNPTDDMVDVLDEMAAYQTHDCLREVLTKGTASNARQLGMQELPSLAGKTGTAYDFTDTWFVGYDSAITCGVWSGFINPKTIYSGAFSNQIALPIWIDYMNASTRSFHPEPILLPDQGKMIEICNVSGQLATEACYQPVEEQGTTVFDRTTVSEFVPTEFHLSGSCSVHQSDSAVEAIRLQTESIMQSGGAVVQYGRSQEGPAPVLVREPTVLGEDPFQSLQPPIRSLAPKKEEPSETNEDKEVTRATVVKEAPLVNPKAHLRLDLPDPIEFTE